ncbi:hypothetical protein BgiMline_017723 [Biomphalaria glabrata]|nr:hypothetical protein BgiMline_005358 [Biomphalaria glabrata]
MDAVSVLWNKEALKKKTRPNEYERTERVVEGIWIAKCNEELDQESYEIEIEGMGGLSSRDTIAFINNEVITCYIINDMFEEPRIPGLQMIIDR